MRIGTLFWIVLLCVGCGGDRPVGPVSGPAAKPAQGQSHQGPLTYFPHSEDWFGIHAWGVAIEEGDVVQVRFWVEAGIMDVNQRLRLVRITYTHKIYGPRSDDPWQDTTPLILAAEHKREDVVRYLLDQEADIYAYSYYGRTALMVAASAGSLPIVKMLVERGGRIKYTDFGGKNALFFSLGGKPGQLAVLKYLVSEGADISRRTKPKLRISMQPQVIITITPLMEAAHFNGPESLAIMTYLLEGGARPNRQNENGWTALMSAAHAGHEDNVRLLVSFGADVNLRNTLGPYGRTAAGEARRRGHVAIADYLDKVASEDSSS